MAAASFGFALRWAHPRRPCPRPAGAGTLTRRRPLLLRSPSKRNERARVSRVSNSVGGSEKGVEEASGEFRPRDPDGKGLGLAGEEVEIVLDESYQEFEWKWPPWKDLPRRYRLIGTTSLAFVICNMDKVNLSIAIIPMSHQFGWNSSTAGLVQSAFFYGYAMSQLPGGWLAKIFGGRSVLEVGVLTWSLATILVPVVAGSMPALVLSRILVGMGEGVSPAASTDLIARSIPLQERSRAVAVVYGGLSVGSVLGLLLAPSLIQNYGWESVFYLFGVLGVIWCLAFEFVEKAESPFSGRYMFGT